MPHAPRYLSNISPPLFLMLVFHLVFLVKPSKYWSLQYGVLDKFNLGYPNSSRWVNGEGVGGISIKLGQGEEKVGK